MVGTRSTTRRERVHRKLFEQQKGAQDSDTEEHKSSTSAATKNMVFKTPAASPSAKTENMSLRSKGHSDTSSVKARKAQLLLDAAKQKAEIRMELIDRQLEADLADLEEEEKYSPHEQCAHDVEQWLERSHHELQSARDHGNPLGKLQPPKIEPAASVNAVLFTAPAAPQGLPTSPQKSPTSVPHLPTGSHPHTVPAPPPAAEATSMQATIQMLAGALKDLASTSAPNTNLITRLSTPKELPDFSGDPLEFLQFKQAFNESTELCKFSPQENLWRLRKCLRGAAKDAVAALLISASPPWKIMSTLELRFGNADLIISRIVQDIKKLPSMSQNYHSEIVPFSVKVQNLIQAVRVVGREEYLQGMSIVSIILSKLPTILLSKWSDYSFPLITEGQKSRMVILSDFLHDEAVKISLTSNICFSYSRTEQNRNKDSSSHRPQTILLQTGDNDNCKFCRTSKHKITECKQFKKALRNTRWQFVKRNGICYKCLVSHHARDTCSAPPCNKNGCGQEHHNLLHYVRNKPKSDAGSSQVPEPKPTPPVQTLTKATLPVSVAENTQTVTHINASVNKVLLKVVPIRIHSSNGVFSANALLDDGSTVSLISAGLAKRAGLRGHSETMCIRGAWSGDELVCETTITNVTLCGMDSKMHSIKVRCVDNLNLPLQQLSVVDCNNYKNLFGINDKLCRYDVKPEILIGQDNSHLLLPLKVIVGKPYEPSATLTPLGWCVHGMLRRPHTQFAASTGEAHATLLLSSVATTAADKNEYLLRELHEEVRHSFAVDALGVSGASETGRTPDTEPVIRPPPPASAPAASALELPTTRNSYETCRLPTTTATCATPASNNYTYLQLHLLCDASVQAMCCVAYWRWIVNGNIKVAFIASKCRVLPVKPMTVPRAELQAALLAARLADAVMKEHRLAPERRYFWCDSTTVLQWIRNNTRRYKTFEANRLGEIDELTRVSEWRYVPTKLNVADLGTREEFNHTLFHSEWFTGPDFLYKDESLWPADVLCPDTVGDDMSSECVAVMHELTCNLPVPEPQRFSSWLRLLRSTAVILKFIARCKKLTGEADCDAMAQAETLLLKKAQVDSFSAEISAIKNGKQISRNSKLLTLSPYLDEAGLLRLGGRIDVASDVDLEMKRPIILDGKHDITRLLVRFFHIKAAHGNQEMVVNNLKQKYWIVRLRPTVKRVVSNCMLCRLRKCTPQVPRMGDLPRARVAHHQRPFSFCGLDLFGPMEVTVGRGRQKRYGVLFTCLTIRAIHIELVSSLTSDSLIMALRRMAARRGWPAHLYSDNGTNLRASDKELKQSQQALNMDDLKAVGMNNAMHWHFIPPSSPHWGGAWERLIRSVKTSLRVVMIERAPREEVLLTLMAEVENIVNGRPLTHVSVDPESLESLTPNHFLLGSSSNSPTIGDFDDSDMFLRKQWRRSQALADMFWRRWVKEVLPELLPRRKWNQEAKPLQVGDLVLVVDPNSQRGTWPKGVIQKICPGKDGRIRLVEVKTKTGVWKRPAARVARISLGEEC